LIFITLIRTHYITIFKKTQEQTPRKRKYLRKNKKIPPFEGEILFFCTFLKRQNFDKILFFSAGSEKPSVLGVHDFSGSAEKGKYCKIMMF